MLVTMASFHLSWPRFNHLLLGPANRHQAISMRNIHVFSECRNLSRNQPRFTRLCTNRVLCTFGRVLLSGAFLLLIPKISCCAAEFVVAGEDSWLRSGLFCFRSNTDTNTQIHLARYNNGRIEPLFAKAIGHTVQAPICLSNGVVATSSDGVIRKLDLKGEILFVAKPQGFDGASALSGKVTDNCIFMTETVYAKPGWRYYLYLVDVAGAEPVVKARFTSSNQSESLGHLRRLL